MVEVPVGQQHGSDAAAAEPRRANFGFEVTTCGGEPVLEAFSRVNETKPSGHANTDPLTARLVVGRAEAVPSTCRSSIEHLREAGLAFAGTSATRRRPRRRGSTPRHRDVNALLDQFCGRLGHEEMGTGHAFQIDDRIVDAAQTTPVGEVDLLATHRGDVHDPPSSTKKGPTLNPTSQGRGSLAAVEVRLERRTELLSALALAAGETTTALAGGGEATGRTAAVAVVAVRPGEHAELLVGDDAGWCVSMRMTS